MMVALGIVAIAVVVVGVVAVLVMASRQSKQDAPPPSRPADFIAPISSGGYRFREVDESPDQFRDRVKQENEEIESQSRRGEGPKS